MDKGTNNSGIPVFGEVIKLLDKEKINKIADLCKANRYTKRLDAYQHLVIMLYAGPLPLQKKIRNVHHFRDSDYLQKETNSSRRSYGKYVARAVHHNIISSDALEHEIENKCSATAGDCKLVLCELADTMLHHLQDGDIVEIPFLGKVKLEIECQAVENESDFKADKHIKGVRLHCLPLSKNSNKELYDGIKFQKE